MRTGRWYDCDSIEEAIVNRKAARYIDIGANIGTCVAAAASLGVQVDAVEAFPKNAFYLSSSVDVWPDTKVKVHSFGLGAKDEVVTIQGSATNEGGSHIVGRSEESSEKGAEHMEITIKRFDDVFGSIVYDVVQMDVEGFECNVVCGALNSVNAGHWKYLQTEFEDRMLKMQGCSEEIYAELLVKLGFVKIGVTSGFPSLGPLLIQDYMYEWKDVSDTSKEAAAKICEQVTS